jgi:signal peptidase II
MHLEPRRAFIPLSIACVVLLLDIVAKWAVMQEVGPAAGRNERWLIGDWLGFSYSENAGVAFGLLQGSSTLMLIAAAFGTLVLIGAFVWMNRSSVGVLVAGGLIAGGAIGNLVDRIRLGHVRDFIAVGPWPTFNVADSAITIGVLVAVWGAMRSGHEEAASPPGVSPLIHQGDARFWT